MDHGYTKKVMGRPEWGSKARKERQRLVSRSHIDRQLIQESEESELYPGDIPCDCEDCNAYERDPR